MVDEEKQFVTTEMFLSKKKILEQKPEPFYSDLFGGFIEVENCHGEAFANFISGVSKEDNMYANSRLIYENCPQFRDPKLLEEYECKDPYMLPQKMYGSRVVEFLRLGDRVMQAYGYTEEVIERLKKK